MTRGYFDIDALTLKNAIGGKDNAISSELTHIISATNFLERMIYFDIFDLLLIRTFIVNIV